MNFPFVYRLKRPFYTYTEDGRNRDPDKLRGLLRYTPFKPAPIKEPKCLFVFTQHDRDHANELYLSLRNGIANYPGCKRLTGISLEKENVEAIKVPEVSEENQSRAFFDAIESRLTNSVEKPDFAFILYSKQPKPATQDPYCGAKTALTKYGIPSQFVSWELLEVSYLFRYAISNIALAFFVKLGGVPWSVSLERRTPTLVFGVGHAEIEDRASQTRRRFIGFATCVLSNGLYLNTSFFSPAETYPQFLDNMEIGLREAMRKMIEDHKDIEKVTIHVSRLERHEMIKRARDTIQNYEQTEQIPIPFELVRLSEDSDFSVFDLSHPGYVSEEGTVVALEPNHALLVTEGRREKAIWRGRKPVTLELHREYSSISTLKMRDAIDDSFRLSSINWRGFNAITQPISLEYAKLLAQKVAKMSQVDPNICSYIEQYKSFNTVPWFI
ncbi:MAG: hypothetical protein HYR94_09505 [Chloroflexi bacterium]|nr:hypothetical protein [Chloroflexota bacterium]